MTPVVFTPIGYFHNSARQKHQLPRQSDQPGSIGGIICLNAEDHYKLALRDLSGFERIWLIYHLHLNKTWKPLVRPPCKPPHANRIGCFASRSPYRPNPIGLSAVRLVTIRDLSLEIGPCDLADGTPILDIKPYIPQYDSFPESLAGWVHMASAERFDILADEEFLLKHRWLQDHEGPDLLRYAHVQLSTNPLDKKNKRIRPGASGYTLAFRTWRVHFELNKAAHSIRLLNISSGYSPEQLLRSADPYGDLALHQHFTALFPA